MYNCQTLSRLDCGVRFVEKYTKDAFLGYQYLHFRQFIQNFTTSHWAVSHMFSKRGRKLYHSAIETTDKAIRSTQCYSVIQTCTLLYTKLIAC